MRKTVTYLLFAAVVLLAVIAFVVFREDINDDTAGFIGNLFRRDRSDGQAGRVLFDEGSVLILADGKLAALSPDRLVMYDKGGTERVTRSVSFDLPALTAAGNKTIAYDRAGASALIADSGGVLAEYPFPVLTAAGNARGQYILVTDESGYRGVARLYDAKNRAEYQWKSAERYIWAASLSPSGRRMAVAAVGQEGETVSLRVTFLEPGRTEPLAAVDIADELALGMASPDNNHVCIITETSVYFYTDDGLPLGRYAYDGQMLLSAPYATADAVFLNLGRNAGGQYSRLVCLSYTGAELGSAPFTEGPAAFAAAGRVCAVLEAGRLYRFTLEGTELNTEDLGPCDARGVLVSEDGGIMLLYSGYGEWYNVEEVVS